MTPEEQTRAALSAEFPDWHVWWVPVAAGGGPTWHSILWRFDDVVANRNAYVVHAEKPAELGPAIAAWLTHNKKLLADEGADGPREHPPT